MANEIQYGYTTGSTLTYGAYQPDGTVRTAAGTSLPEIGATGYYTATDANVVAGDAIIIKSGVNVIGYLVYKPDVTASVVSSKLNSMDAKIDSLVSAEGKIFVNYPLPDALPRITIK